MPPTLQQINSRSNPQAFDVNLPGEGTTFRAVGDTNASTLYAIKNGQLTNLGGNQQIANTDLRGADGTIYKAGQAITGTTNGLAPVNSGFNGTYWTNTGVRGGYDAQNGAGAYDKLGQYNIADLTAALQRGGQAGTTQTLNGQDVANNTTAQLAALSQAQTQPTQQYPAQMFNQSAPQNQFPTQNLQPGDNGPQVKALQDYLVAQGYLTPQQLATGPGNYGPATTKAVAALQAKLGVQNQGAEGYFGPKTLAALQAGIQSAQGGAANMGTSSTNTPPSTNAGQGSTTGSTPVNPMESSDVAMKAYLAALGGNTDINTTQYKIDALTSQQQNINASRDLGIQGVNEQPIATPFLTGESAAITNRAAVQSGALQAQISPLQTQLARQQAIKQSAIDVTKAASDYQQKKDLQTQSEKAAAALETQRLSANAKLAAGGQLVDSNGNVLATNPKTFAPAKGTAASGSLQKGKSETNDKYVERVLSSQGFDYNDKISKVPAGKIGVINNKTGELASILPEEFNSALYTRL